MCWRNVIVELPLDTGPVHADGAISTRSASGSENAPLARCPGSLTLSVASAAVLVMAAVVCAVYSLSTPGVNAPKVAGAARLSDSVAGTVPATLAVACTPGEPTSLAEDLNAPLTPAALSCAT